MGKRVGAGRVCFKSGWVAVNTEKKGWFRPPEVKLCAELRFFHEDTTDRPTQKQSLYGIHSVVTTCKAITEI